MISSVLSSISASTLQQAILQTFTAIILQKWPWILLLFLLGQFHRTLKTYIVQRPKDILITGLPTLFGQWITSLRYHVVALDIVRDGYIKARGRLYAVPAIDKYQVFASTREQINEVANAPIENLSFNAAVDEQFLPNIIFNGFRFDPKDPRYSIPVHAMKVQLRDNLQGLIPILREKLKLAFRMEFPQDKLDKGWIKFSPHLVSQRMVEKMNNVVLVGEELANDPVYLKAAMRYTRDIVMTGEILRFTPRSLQQPIGWLAMRWSGAKNLVAQRVTSVMWDRINHGVAHGHEPCDLIQWMLDATRKKTPQAVTKLVQHVMGLMFGGAHQLPMLVSFALYNLCKHPECLMPLRHEITAMEANTDDPDNYDNMPLMDSFLKETARLNPTVILTMPRKVLNSPFKFADGTVVPTNNWICVPQQAIMQDEANYQDPSTFNGFRFAKADALGDPASKFSTPSFDFPFWGSSKRPCPGRFYVAVVAKMILSHFIANYDFSLVNQNDPQALAWSYALVPHPFTKLLMRRRVGS